MRNPVYSALKEWNIAASAAVEPIQFVAYKGDGYNLTYIEARTVEHRANAYPKLVEVLKNVSGCYELVDAKEITQALLRELGEAQ